MLRIGLNTDLFWKGSSSRTILPYLVSSKTTLLLYLTLTSIFVNGVIQPMLHKTKNDSKYSDVKPWVTWQVCTCDNT